MFASVGRRLALLNAAVVVLVIALTGGATFVLLRRSLMQEADQALRERAQAAQVTWAGLFASGQPDPSPVAAIAPDQDEDAEDSEEAEDDDNESHEVLEGGDTLLYAFGADGGMLADARGIAVTGLPAMDAVWQALDGEPDTRTLRIQGQNVRVYTAPVMSQGKIVGAIQAARGQGEHEAELRQVAYASLTGIGGGILVAVLAGLFLADRAMRPIDTAFARQRAFVADASHELRTPLTLIRATAELVQRLPSASAEVRDEAGHILTEVDAMAGHVDDLLLLARLDDAALAIEHRPLDLGEIVQAAATTMADHAAGSGLSLSVRVEQPVIAVGDANRIQQVVRILLDNAMAYTPTGGTIDVRVGHRGAKATVSVADTGIGISAVDQPRVFDRFYRADHARPRSTGGTGLGLAIARALVEAHGGQIGLESNPGRGTTVWFTLPTSDRIAR